MKVYQGTRTGMQETNTAGDAVVSVYRNPSSTSHPALIGPLKMTKLAKSKSPTGFNWGYLGSGCAALAHSILFDATGDAELSDELYQQFKSDFVARWPQGKNWSLPSQEVLDWVQAHRPDAFRCDS